MYLLVLLQYLTQVLTFRRGHSRGRPTRSCQKSRDTADGAKTSRRKRPPRPSPFYFSRD